MCQRLYIASRSALPPVRASRKAPYLAVAPLANECVRQFFSAEAKYMAEARGHVECGCGFPEANDERPNQAVPREDAETVKTLAAYLGSLPKRKHAVELVLSNVGMETEPPTTWRDVSIPDLLVPAFRFRRGEGLRVRLRSGEVSA